MDEWSAHRKAEMYSGVSLWMSGQPIDMLNFTAVCPFGSAHRKAKLCSGVSLWVSGQPIERLNWYSGVSLWMNGQPIERLNCTAVCHFG